VLAQQPGQGSYRVQEIKLNTIGQTNIASSISYLDDGYVYVGSAMGDSQLVRLSSSADAQGSFVQTINTETNLAPIVDFIAVDLEK
jgi:DNA damage-binding protein 1